MIYQKLVSRRTYFFNNCGIISACVVCAALSAVVVMGLRIYVTQFPRFLGNAPENIAYIKTTTDPNEFTFIVVGDVKSGTETFEAMLDVIHQDKPAFAVILGDFVDHTDLISHKLFALEMAEHAHDFPIFIVPGNHDISAEGQFRLKDFQNTYGPAQFCFTIDRYLFVFLDVISPYGQKNYLKFLEKAISSQPEKIKKTFVFMHIPPSGLNPSLICNGLPGSEKFLMLARKYHIDYVFAGDHHGYVKTEKDGTNFIVTGGGGGRLRGRHGRFHHLVRMGVQNEMVTETVIATKRHIETAELIERNIVFYLWPIIVKNPASITITLVLFGINAWLLIFSLRRRKKFRKVTAEHVLIR
jgi:1,2-diacylglycerol 3-alpha-glucosyltransferase